jgi:O-6-methylguanine DNA methyltransferase
MTPDRLDDLLAGHFRPEPPSPDLVRAVLGAARRAEAGAGERLAEGFFIAASRRGLTRLEPRRPGGAGASGPRGLVARARAELCEYLAGRRAFFSVPVDLSAAGDFQRRVLAAAREIPFGETRSYVWLADRVGAPRAARAVGTALARNPVPIVVPCHRVCRRDGGLGGYALGLAFKRRLLALERTTPLLVGSAATRVVCRTGCAAARRVRPDRRIVFASLDDARSVGYRPCRLCRPPDV